MTHLEIEYKTLLTKDEFNRLNSQLSHVTPVTQTNYYFDSDNFDMKAHRMSLRIRTLPNRAEITLKIPKEVGNLEYNYDLSVADAKEIIKSGQFPEVDFLKLIEDIGLMALDSNQYADIKDYELELEVENAEKGKKDFDNFLAQHDIDFKYAKSKVARFSATLKRN